MSIQATLKAAAQNGADQFFVGDKSSAALWTADRHARFMAAVLAGNVFSLILNATNATPQAGQIVGAAAAASTQFALLNPPTSKKNAIIWELGIGLISGTAPAGPLWHGLGNGSIITLAGSATPRCMDGSTRASAMTGYGSAGGAALTGGLAPNAMKMADFASTASAQASVNGLTRCLEDVGGKIIVPPGSFYVPLWSAAGTSFLVGYSLSWEEVDI